MFCSCVFRYAVRLKRVGRLTSRGCRQVDEPYFMTPRLWKDDGTKRTWVSSVYCVSPSHNVTKTKRKVSPVSTTKAKRETLVGVASNRRLRDARCDDRGTQKGILRVRRIFCFFFSTGTSRSFADVHGDPLHLWRGTDNGDNSSCLFLPRHSSPFFVLCQLEVVQVLNRVDCVLERQITS